MFTAGRDYHVPDQPNRYSPKQRRYVQLILLVIIIALVVIDRLLA